MAEKREVDITTTTEPKSVTRTSQELNGFTNPDGSRNEAAYREFEEGKQRLAAAYRVDPETGHVKHLSDILNFDPVASRKRREEEEALNRRKQKESAWVNAIAALGDMITTAAGGNVWKREPDKHAKEAHDANMNLRREQQAEDVAIGQQKQRVEQAYANAVENLRARVGSAYGTRVYKTETEGGDTHQSGFREGASPRTGSTKSTSSSSSGGSGSKNAPKIVNVTLSNGKTAQLHMSSNAYAASGKYLSSLYNALIASGNENIAKVLEDSGINPQKDGTYKAEDLLSSGIVFDNPQVRDEFIRIIQNDPDLTEVEKQEIERGIKTYPALITKPQKKSILQRVMDLFGKKEEPKQSGGWKPGSNNEATSDLVD